VALEVEPSAVTLPAAINFSDASEGTGFEMLSSQGRRDCS
jgi:hypothetical protein